jgi:drug/metabolite transporter (DMT)-like permease
MRRDKIIGYTVTFTAGFSFGTIPVIIALLRDVETSIIEQAFLRLFLGGLFGCGLLGFSYFNQREIFQQSSRKNVQRTYVLQSLFFTLALIVYIGSIILETPVGQASLLIQVHPIITLILGFIILHEKITKNKLVSLLLGFIGLILLTTPWEWQSMMQHILGDLLAMSNGILYAFYLLIGAHSVKIREKVPSHVSISWILLWGLLWGFLLLFALTLLPLPSESTLFDPGILIDPYILSLGIILTTTGSIIPYGLILLSNKYNIESSRQSILLLGEPIAAMILGLLILSEPITIWYIAGGVILMLAIVNLVITKED